MSVRKRLLTTAELLVPLVAGSAVGAYGVLGHLPGFIRGLALGPLFLTFAALVRPGRIVVDELDKLEVPHHPDRRMMMEGRLATYRSALKLASHSSLVDCLTDKNPTTVVNVPFPPPSKDVLLAALRDLAGEYAALQWVDVRHIDAAEQLFAQHQAFSVHAWMELSLMLSKVSMPSELESFATVLPDSDPGNELEGVLAAVLDSGACKASVAESGAPQWAAERSDQVRTTTAAEVDREAQCKMLLLLANVLSRGKESKTRRRFLWNFAKRLDLATDLEFRTENLAKSPSIGPEDSAKLVALTGAPENTISEVTPRRLALAHLLVATADASEQKLVQGVFDSLDEARDSDIEAKDVQSWWLFAEYLQPTWALCLKKGAVTGVWVTSADDGARLKLQQEAVDVAELRKAIKLEKPNAFKNIDADQIQVFEAKDGKPVGEALAADSPIDKHSKYMFRERKTAQQPSK